MNLRNRISVNIVDETRTEDSIINAGSPAVYVIGFMGNKEVIGLDEYFTPVYCDSISTFTDAFGDEPVFYGKDICYWDDDNNTPRFSENAFPAEKSGHDYTTQQRVVYEGQKDIGWTYAKKLLQLGLPVVYEAVYSERAVNSEGLVVVTEPYGIYEYMAGKYKDIHGIISKGEILKSPFDISADPCAIEEGNLANINEYDIRFITSGGLPVLEYHGGKASVDDNVISHKMIYLAEKRGDCIALLDHTNYKERPFVGEKGLVKRNTIGTTTQIDTVVLDRNSVGDAYSRAAIFTPWGRYFGANVLELPGSFGYLVKFANMIVSNASWLAVAGVNRGVINDFVPSTVRTLTNNVADILVQASVPINAVTFIHGYGQTIYGNSTIYNPSGDLKASQKMNIQVLVTDVVKEARRLSYKYLFEQNSTALFYSFKADLSKLLDVMLTGSGLSSYKILRDTNNTEKDKLSIIVRLYTIYAIEAIEIGVRINDDQVEVVEE